MRKVKFALKWGLLGFFALSTAVVNAQDPIDPNGGRTHCMLVSESCTTGQASITPTFDLHANFLDGGTYRVQIKLYRGELKQQFNVSFVINEVLVSTINSPSVILPAMTTADFDMADFFQTSPLFSGTNQNGIYRAKTTLQRSNGGGSWTDIAWTFLEDSYPVDDVPPLDPCTYCDEMLTIDGLKRGPYFKFSINGNFGETPPHEFYSCSGVPLMLHATGWTGSTDFSTLKVTKGLWTSNNGFVATAPPDSIQIYESSLYMDKNLTTTFSLSNYSGYLEVKYTLSPDICEGVSTPVSKTQIIKVSPATFLGSYNAKCYVACNPPTSGSKAISATPNITATMPSSTNLPMFKCQIANAIGWEGATSVGINNLTFSGTFDVDVYESDASGNRKVVSSVSAPSIFRRHGNTADPLTVELSFNEWGYSAGFDAAYPPFYVSPLAPADPNGNSLGGDFFQDYYSSAYSTATLAAYSAKIFCAEVSQVTDGGCIVNKKSYFRIANNGVSNGAGARPTGLDEMSTEDASLRVVPNPSTGIFTIMYDNLSRATIEVLDMFGRSLKKAELSDNTPYHLDLSGEAKGIYLLRLNSEGKTQTKKMILQ